MYITSFFFDSKQKLWVGTRKGVFLAQNLETAKAGEWHNFLENMLVTCMYEDNEKNIWIGSMGKALFFIPHSDISWIHQPYLEAASQITTSLYADEQKRIWSGHDNSSFIIHTKSGEIKHSLGKPSNLERISKIKKVNDAIWIIGKSKTRVIRNADTMDLPYYGNDLILDGHENYWLASTYIYVIPKKKIDRQLSSKGTIEKNGLSGDSILLRKRGNVLYEDPQGGIWIGLFEGLYYFKDGTIENLSERHPNLRGKINDISCLPDSQNILVATDNFGLVELNIQSKRPNETSRFRQLGSLSCYAITIHNQDCWLGTNKGIIYIDLSEQSKAIGYSDLLGLKNLHVLDIVVVDDKLYAASSNGLLEFNQILPKQIYKQAPPIFLTGIFQKDKRLPNLHDVVLSYWENELTLRFKGISFRERGNLSYKYQLIGLDQNFQYTNNQEVVLKALPPGKYDLILFAINKAGIESKVPAEFSFSIQKPYWQEWWFVLLIVLSAIAIAALTWRLRLSIVRREYELENARLAEEKRSLKLENELSEVEQHALRLQMNPHFIFNALNSIKGYYAEKKVAEADEYLSRFAKILRHILENTHRYSSLEEELEILHLYIEMAQMRHPGMLEYTIEVEPGLNASDFSLPALLLQPFVENAIMHGIAPKSGGGHIQIKCSLNEGNLICVIKDNGIGLSNSKLKRKESEHQSKAIEISKKRLEYITRQEGVLCRLEINDDIENGAIIGTVVTITIPANKLW